MKTTSDPESGAFETVRGGRRSSAGHHGRGYTWQFQKLRGTLFWGPYNKEPTFIGTKLGSLIFGNSHLDSRSRALRYTE